jgi:hypothetical protein
VSDDPYPGEGEAGATTREPRRDEGEDGAVSQAAEATTQPKAVPHRRGGGRRRPRAEARSLLRDLPRRDHVLMAAGAELRLLVLACTDDDTTAVDLSSGALIRLRVTWPENHAPDLAAFDVVEAKLADDPEHDDLAHPEAVTAAGLPRQVGTLRGRRVRHMLQRLAAPPDGPLLGFPGPAAAYWEFRGHRPSAALVVPTRGPQLIRRPTDGSTWVRFGWQRDDVWLRVEDRHAVRALDAARRERLAGKALETALGFAPQYLLASLSRPRDGHCYKVCTAVLPRG